jgi:hypothetical protein
LSASMREEYVLGLKHGMLYVQTTFSYGTES